MKKGIIEQIIEIFSTEEINQEEVEMNFVDVKTADGRILRVSDLALEADVQEMDVDGNLIAVADGDYELESGEVISVLDGKIAEISSPEEEEAEDAAEDAVPVAAQMSAENLDEEVENLEFESLISNLKELVAEVKALKEGFESIKNENEELKASVEKFAKTPSAEETKKVIDFSKIESKREPSLMRDILLSKNK
jgi:hypothetical protein